ncbi:uncharacterized protein LOC127254637 [Andrographis paniculata]|uniref:uncharacterized protein LOC127254637 n=1 Tax=Andrographis paniculata TaxID=175694 RepID=UPI0021E97573|nr:uncharacterized protein LOC127254637 [Andrographis paniculata]
MGERVTAAAAEMAVTEQQLAEALESILLDTTAFTSLNGVVQQLESKLGVDLSHKLDFIRGQIHHFLLRSQPQSFLPHQLQQNGRFILNQSPNFHPHLPHNFAAYNPAEGYGLRPAPPPQTSQRPPPLPVATASRMTVARVSPKARVPAVRRRRGGPGGLNKLCGVSPELQTIVGQPTLPRTEIVKQLWAYIRKNNLQDPNNRRKIICNDELRLVLETDCIDMFRMNKLLAKHIFALEQTKQTGRNTKKLKVEDEEPETKIDEPVPIVVVSEELGSFLGTDEREMSQAEVLRQMWEYIKIHQLEDPSNPMSILCDVKLRELLGCESVSALRMPEMLEQRHLFKKS